MNIEKSPSFFHYQPYLTLHSPFALKLPHIIQQKFDKSVVDETTMHNMCHVSFAADDVLLNFWLFYYQNQMDFERNWVCGTLWNGMRLTERKSETKTMSGNETVCVAEKKMMDRTSITDRTKCKWKNSINLNKENRVWDVPILNGGKSQQQQWSTRSIKCDFKSDSTWY